MDPRYRDALRRKLTRQLAERRAALESTRREDYALDAQYRRVVTLRTHLVRRLERELAALDE